MSKRDVFWNSQRGGLRLNSEFWYFRWFMWIQFYFHSNVLNRVESETQRNKKGISRNNRRRLLLPSSGGMALLPCRRTRSHLSGNFSLCPLLSLKTFAEGMKEREKTPCQYRGCIHTPVHRQQLMNGGHSCDLLTVVDCVLCRVDKK